MLDNFKKLNKMIQSAIVISIIALIFSFIPNINYFGYILGLIGLFVGLVNILKKNTRNNTLYKKTTWISLALSILAIIISIFTASLTSNDDDDSATNDTSSSISSKPKSKDDNEDSDSKKEDSSDASDKSSEESVDPASYDTGITFDQLARTPKQYTNQKVSFTGSVIQATENGSTTQVLLAVDGDSDNTAMLNINNKKLNGSRILENDLIDIKGISHGTTSYESIMNEEITTPLISVDIINNQGPAPEDYGY